MAKVNGHLKPHLHPRFAVALKSQINKKPLFIIRVDFKRI